MPSPIILVFSLLAQLGPGDVTSPIGPSSGNTTSGGLGGLDRSATDLGDSQGPFGGGAPPLNTGSETRGSDGTSGSAAGTSTIPSPSSDIPVSGANGSGFGGTTTTRGAGIGGGGMR